MARIAGVDIPNEKRITTSLTYIFGIGPHRAVDICRKADIDPEIKTRDLTPGLAAIRDETRRMGKMKYPEYVTFGMLLLILFLWIAGGEELGLPEVLDIPDDRREDPVFIQTNGERIGRDGCRIPIPWTDDPSTAFGFSAVNNDGADKTG